VDLPEQVYICPKVNAYKHSQVGVFRFSDPVYACGTGKMAADAIFDELLRKGVFSYVVNEAKKAYLGTANSLDLARSRGYDLIITGDVLYYFDGSDLKPSSVDERICVVHVSTGRVLWSASARSQAFPTPSRDLILFQKRGVPAKPAAALIKENAEKFSNMMLKQPKQENSADGSIPIPLRSHREAVEGLQSKVNDLLAQNELLEQAFLKEVEKNKDLEEEVDDLSVQADELENQLKAEIEKGEISVKRYENKTIINIDNRICFDSGSADLKKGVKNSLVKISKTLKSFPGNSIRVEGHTDNIPIRNGRFHSNWELSSARALAVLRFLLANSDIEPERLSAAGYGEYHPIGPNDSLENRNLNRRVDIVIVPSDTQKADLERSPNPSLL